MNWIKFSVVVLVLGLVSFVGYYYLHLLPQQLAQAKMGKCQELGYQADSSYVKSDTWIHSEYRDMYLR